MVYYRVDQGSKNLVHTTFLDHDDRGDYHFDLVFADHGNLACVYEVTRYRQDSSYILIFDAVSGASWPRSHTPGDEKNLVKWREVYKKIKAENPGLKGHLR
jgi:hypothetical protein